MTETNEIWVLAEQKNRHIARVTLELLGKAVEFGTVLDVKVASVLIGSNVNELTGELAAYGSEKIYAIDDPKLNYYQGEAYAANVTDLVRQYKPVIFLIGSTDTGRDLAPRVAAEAGTGLTAHCIGLEIEYHDGIPLLSQIVPGWGVTKRMKILCPQKRPQMVTVKPGVFDVPKRKAPGNCEIVQVMPKINDRYFRSETIEVKAEEVTSRPIEEADVVIAVGWGVYSMDNLELIKELAEILGAVIGGTRPMVDKGWIAEKNMIGQSGKVVSPKLFISLGASGAMHFTTGFEKAKFIIAVDENPEAPIFKIADIGIVGDLREVVPCLIDELKKRGKGNGK